MQNEETVKNYCVGKENSRNNNISFTRGRKIQIIAHVIKVIK